MSVCIKAPLMLKTAAKGLVLIVTGIFIIFFLMMFSSLQPGEEPMVGPAFYIGGLILIVANIRLFTE